MRVLQAEAYIEPRDALAQDWSSFLSIALPNAVWLALPNIGAKKIRNYCEKWGINRLILTGGENIGETEIRDETEQDLLVWAVDSAVPVLGICRGMQLMGVMQGIELKPVEEHVRTRHKLEGEYSHEVNSYHNYSLKECPKGFEVTARSQDGVIEAIRNNKLKWEGWMWHPERENEFNSEDITRIQRLFS
jgi:putative glutamine amidotransferase